MRKQILDLRKRYDQRINTIKEELEKVSEPGKQSRLRTKLGLHREFRGELNKILKSKDDIKESEKHIKR